MNGLSKTETLYNSLAERILSGLWSGGDKLPSEQELCSEFSVSRITVRAAMEKLRKNRFVYSVQGSGSFVGWAPESEANGSAGQSTTVEAGRRHSFELIRCLETEAAGLAASRRNADDLDALRETLENQKQARDAVDLRREDIRFHEQIFRASKNPLFGGSIAQIAPQDAGIINIPEGDCQQKLPEMIRQSLEPHLAIFHAIENGDMASARSAMRYHLDQLNGL